MTKHKAPVKFLLLCLAFLFAASAVIGVSAQNETSINTKAGTEQYFTETCTEYVSDFSSAPKGWDFFSKSNAVITNGILTCEEGKSFTLATKKVLGDQYGLLPAELSFKMALAGGSVTIAIRDFTAKTKRDELGLRITIDTEKVIVTEPVSGFRAEAALPFAVDGECIYTLKDNRNIVELYIEKEGENKCALSIEHKCFGDENSIAVLGKISDTNLSVIGYAKLYVDDLKGYIDDLKYATSELVYNGAGQQVDYTYWVSADDLDRTTPEHQKTGDPKENKYVGVFYFICHVGGWPIIDHTQLYQERGLDGLKQFLSTKEQISYGNYWSEPYFGYYIDVDEWVLRKHAQMLCDAGVDFIFVDISNAETYKSAHTKLFETWYQIRQEGGQTPQICFLTGDTEGRLLDHLNILKTTVYSNKNFEKYKDLFFLWEGKPLIFGNAGRNLSEKEQKLLDQFTVRRCWAWKNTDGYWNWLTESPQYEGRDANGIFEQMSVVMGHHASTSKGRSYTSAGGQPNNGKQDFEFSSTTAKYGYCFDEQFQYAIEADPSVIMITGWNEWIAGCQSADDAATMANTQVNNYMFVDAFNTEFSRDGEPMKIRDGLGFGDNYYYQMVNYIRLFKGTNEMKKAEGRATIDINGGLQQWDNIYPEYTDTAGDTAPRSELSFDSSFKYVNNTGRNDIATAKVAQDDANFYFLVQTVKDIILDDGENWMNLYLDIDQNSKTGWEGYDYVINRSRSDGKMTVQRFVDNSWQFENTGEAEYSLRGNTIMLRLPKSVVNTKVKYLSFDFKWADHSTVDGNVMEFMDLGDAAPNSRFNFRFVGDDPYYAKRNTTMIVLLCAAVLLVIAAIAVLVVIVRKRNGRNNKTLK
ncbi:MAG: hypothetical protein KIC77_07520 [Clostridiales bacterium]|nr:hypothetical protein [Clostridiales bacterium]